ncbi:MAG: hypothetical protein ACREIF_17520 [Chthoniobacterales bacterium]
MMSLTVAALVFILAASVNGRVRRRNFCLGFKPNKKDGSVFAQLIRSVSGRTGFFQKRPWWITRDMRVLHP